MRFSLIIIAFVLVACTLVSAADSKRGPKSTRQDTDITVITSGNDSTGGSVSVTADKINGKTGVGAGSGRGTNGGDRDTNGGIIDDVKPRGDDETNNEQDNDLTNVIDDVRPGNKTGTIEDLIDNAGKTGDELCVDRVRSCQRARRFCQSPRLREIMTISCAKTCNRCTDGAKPVGVNAGRGRRGNGRAAGRGKGVRSSRKANGAGNKRANVKRV